MVRACIPHQPSVRMTLLLDEIDVLATSGDPDAVDVRGVEHDSRRVERGDLFCCLVGRQTDGHDHASEAIARGAVGLVCERPVVTSPARPARPIVEVRVAPGSGRAAMARLAAAFWGHPARALVTAGVTGTNGKTTVTQLLGAVLEHAGHPTTVIGTLSGPRTTPESTELQRTFAAVRDAHGGGPRPAVAMEVSSHALAQSRVDAVRFDVAVFTNLSHDHLDFHGTMDAYFAAKASLFEPERAARAVVNADDPWGQRLIAGARIPTVAVHPAEVTDVRLAVGRSQFTWRGHHVRTALTGLVNVYNAHLAAEAALALGVPSDVVAAGLAGASPVPGRLEALDVGDLGFDVIIDYAHTPAALAAALEEAGRLAHPRGGRTIVVFGCGGDRDQAKRPVMGRIAGRLADVAVVTSDNPRGEEPGTIIAGVLAGVEPPASPVVEPDRRRAIEVALSGARAGDVVLVAGKGHETVQVVGDTKLPFDDRAVAAEAIGALRALRSTSSYRGRGA